MFRKFSFYVSFVLVLCLFGNTWGVEWAEKDIGGPGIAGSSSYDAGTDTWTVYGSGHDVWGAADGGHYVYKPMSGDGSLQLNLLSMDVTSGWAKVGPAIRETATASSRHAMTAMTGSNGVQFVRRETTGGPSADITAGGVLPPKYLRITREGNLFTAEYGVKYPWLPTITWQWSASATVPMGEDVTVGMFVCATNQGALCEAMMQGVLLTADPYLKPWDFSPADGATGLSLTPTLDWRAGDGATSYDVMMGTDPGALAPVATVTDTIYTVDPPLAENTDYYWQIVSQPGGHAGPVLKFKTYYVPPWYTGSVVREIWGGMWWAAPIERLLWQAEYMYLPPSWWDVLPQMYSPDFGWGDYGGRMSAHLIPGTSGDYTFWVASDDATELRISTDTAVANLERIAYHNDWTNVEEWDKYGTQKSATIPLEAGQKYYLEAIWKEGGGGDHCEAGWEGPDSPSRSLISGDYLTAAYARAPKPEIRQTYTPLEVENLSWSPGIHATEQEVLFGTDPGAMVPIATALAGDVSSIPAPEVAVDTTYYWQVNCTDGTDTWTGDVWSFTVLEFCTRNIGQRLEQNPGNSSYDPGTGIYTLNSTGHELWGDFDEFHFRYTTMKMTRDKGSIQARVLSISPDHWRRGGVMIRENLSASSRQITMHKTGHNNVRLQVRDGYRAWTYNINDWWGLPSPVWVKIERDGSSFDTYHSLDGEEWTHRGNRWIPMEAGKPVYIGLACGHHQNAPGGYNGTTTATFDNLLITTPDPRQAWDLNPPNGSTMVDIHATLSWNPGDGATEHHVYFSADEEAVINRTVDPIVLPAETTSVEVGPLDMGMVYYWCVDEVVNPVIPGEVISFTAEDYRTIDDFEAYDPSPEALPEQIMIPGEVLVEAVPPPAQEWVEPVILIDAIEPASDCLVSRWDFEGDYTDSVSGYDGTPMGDATIVTDAERGDVLSLDGDLDYVDCGNPAELNFSTGNWSLSAWVKNTMTGTGDINKGSIIANGGDGGGGHRYCLVLTEQKEGKVTLVIDDNKGDGIGSSYDKKQARGDATKVNNGVWHHVLGVRDGDRIRIYIDGVLEGSKGIGGADYDLSGTVQANVLIGALTKASDSSIYKDYEGLIDDVRIYDCALTVENARYLAEIGPLVKPGYYSPCIVHWAMDEGSGDTVADSSGNGLDGDITDAAWTATTADGSAACLDFEGGANVVNEAAGPYLNNLGGLSMTMWIQSDVINTDQGFIIGRDPEGNDQRGMRYDSVGADAGGDDVIKYGVRTDDDAEQSESSEYVQTTEWQHVAMVWDNDGTGSDLYINGVLDTPTHDDADVTGLTEGYTKLLAGKGGKDGAADASWDGRIDDVRVYDCRLTYGQVRYLAGVGNLALPDTYLPLVAHYEFEGNYDDSTGNNRHGTPIGDGVTIETDPDMGMVLSLPGGTNDDPSKFVEVGEVGISGNDPTTISCWAKTDVPGWDIPDWTLIFGFTGNADGGGGDGTHFNIGVIGGPQGIGAHIWGWEETILPDDVSMDWHHYAMTYDGTRIDYYGDGFWLDTDVGKSNVRSLAPRADRVHIGSRVTQNSSFYGDVDDARIYNVCLTKGQVATLAGAAYTDAANLLPDTWSGRASAAPALEYMEPAHEGSLSMRVEYTGSGAVTRLEPWDDGKHPHGWNGDFSLGQAQALALWFKGDPENAPGAMFAQLTTVVPSGHTQRVMYDGDPEDLQNPMWQEWTMSLKALSTGKPADPIEEMGLPITKIKDVGVGIIGAGGGTLYFDDLRLYPTRCVPKYGPAYDLTDDCVVDRDDLWVLVDEWLAEPAVVEEDWDRVAYYDDRYPTGWADPDVAQGVRDYLGMLGYTVLNADELKTWMDARIADGALSVVVFCQDIAPDTVVETMDASCTVRKYLDAGGKIVFYADIPFYYQGHADGTQTTWAVDGSINILGFNAAGAGWDSGNLVTITSAGANWGLTQPWQPSARPALAGDVDTVLATDDDGDAAAWAKRYLGGDFYRGFVRVFDFDVTTGDAALLADLVMVAEYIHDELTADLNEDDIVNFLDYTDLINHFGDEKLFPPPEEQL